MISSLYPYIETEPEVAAEVYTLSSDSWRRIGISLRPNVVFSNIQPYSCATFVCRALHWLANISEGDGKFLNQNMILSFDVHNNKFGEIALPDGIEQRWQHLVEIKENLAFITLEYSRMDFVIQYSLCSIWAMGEYVYLNAESWNKLYSMRLKSGAEFIGCTRYLVEKDVNAESDASELQNCNDNVIVSIDLETLHKKNLDIQPFPTIVTTFIESLLLLDGASELSG